MDTSTVILHLAIILITARVFGEIVAYYLIPSVIGEIIAGVILGPSLFGLIQPVGFIQILSEIGIILLLFQVGLETDIGHLFESGIKSVVVALGGFIAPFILCFSLSYYWFELEILVSLMIAGTMTATSIGITMRLLTDLGKQNSKEGQIILGAAVLDDILGVILLAILFDFSLTNKIDVAGASRIIVFMMIFFMIAPILAKAISYLIKRFEPKSMIPGIIPTSIVALVLLLAWISHAVGIPELLGGFATGLALSRRFFIPFGIALRANQNYSEHVHKQMKPIIQLFTPIFFVYIGLSLDLSAIDWSSHFFWYFSLSLTALAIVSKIGGALLIKENLARKLVIGMSMVPRGEVGLVFAEIYAAVVIVIAYTTIFTPLFTPLWLRYFYQRYGTKIIDSD